jgi:hypothetical protein
MYNISARRATESDYGLITKDNKPLEFETEQRARKWASANIEANMIVSWSIIRAEVTNMTSKVMVHNGTIRISNPKTLQSWIDRGWYQKSI